MSSFMIASWSVAATQQALNPQLSQPISSLSPSLDDIIVHLSHTETGITSRPRKIDAVAFRDLLHNPDVHKAPWRVVQLQ